MPRSVSSAFWAKLQRADAQMCELIEVAMNTERFYWTTNNAPVVASGQTWVPVMGEITSPIKSTTALTVEVLQAVLANSGDRYTALVQAKEPDHAAVRIDRVFVDTPGLGAMNLAVYRIGNYKLARSLLEAEARNKYNSAEVRWPNYTYRDTCSWRFGGPGCGVNVSSYTITSSGVNSVVAANAVLASATVISSVYAAGRLEGGKFKILTGVNSGLSRRIRVHTGDLIYFAPTLPYSLEPSAVVQFSPGCKKRYVDDCTSLYNASSNFLGWPWIPRQDQVF